MRRTNNRWTKHLSWFVRWGLFTLILSLGTTAALISAETEGLALADLSTARVGAVTEDAGTAALYAVLNDIDNPEKTSGIYRSRDEGRTWQHVSLGPAAAISALALHPDQDEMIFAGASQNSPSAAGSLWLSRDGGNVWDAYHLRLPAAADGNFPGVTSLLVHPQQDDVLYVGTNGQGLYRFDQAGGGYELLGGAALRNLYVQALVAAPEGALYAITTAGLFRVQGDTWQQLDQVPGHAVSLAIAPHNPQQLYVGTVADGIFRSDDGGQSWTALNTGLGQTPGVLLRVSAISLDPAEPQHIAVATAIEVGSRVAPDQIFESWDGGQRWQSLGHPNAVVETLHIRSGGVYAATPAGLHRYGQPLVPSSPLTQAGQMLLQSPSLGQAVILVISLVLGSLVLLWRQEWWFRSGVHQT